MPEIIEDAENELTMDSRHLFTDLYEELCQLDEKIKCYDKKLDIIFKNSDVCKRLSNIEGIGVIGSTALIAAIGDARVFKNGRQMSAWLGLTPRQHSSGNKRVLLGIGKKGDCYIRKTLIHGARAVVYQAKNKTDRRSLWINSIAHRRGNNKACVAVANKNVRIIWSMLMHGTDYQKAA